VFVVEENRWEGGRKLQEGDMVYVGMTVARLPDLSSMRVRAVLSDVDDGLVRPGMTATCSLDAYPDRAYPCRVTAVAPVARESDRSSLLRAFEVGLDLGAGEPGRMRPGMSVKVEVETAAAGGVLLAPRAALEPTAAGARARLAGGGWREVTLGPCDAWQCAVEEGLEEGDRLAPVGAGPGAGG
jgi:multidrug efflux pump subunit AcrA (membrane-fusion protein)